MKYQSEVTQIVLRMTGVNIEHCDLEKAAFHILETFVELDARRIARMKFSPKPVPAPEPEKIPEIELIPGIRSDGGLFAEYRFKAIDVEAQT